MSRYRATTTIVHRGIVEAEDGQPVKEVEENAVEEALQAIEFGALDVVYAVELEPLAEEGEV